MRYLDLEALLQLADLAVGGQALIRDVGLLDSAAARPRSGFGDFEAYASLHLKAAALLHSLVRNHALVDGNKRLGWTAAVAFCDINGVVIEAPDDEAYDLVISVAEGRVEVAVIATSFERWARATGQ